MKPTQKGAQRAPISTGVTSMVLVFVMLCLITFSVLSLVSAQADLRLSRKSAERTTAYYEAENAASDVLIALDAILAENAGAPDAASYFAAVRAASGGTLDVEFPDESHVAWQVPLGADQCLQVQVELVYPVPADGARWRIVAWQAVGQYDWQQEQPLELIRPGELPAA